MRFMKTSGIGAASHGGQIAGPGAGTVRQEMKKKAGGMREGRGLIPARLRAAATKGDAAAVHSVRITIKGYPGHFGVEPQLPVTLH